MLEFALYFVTTPFGLLVLYVRNLEIINLQNEHDIVVGLLHLRYFNKEKAVMQLPPISNELKLGGNII